MMGAVSRKQQSVSLSFGTDMLPHFSSIRTICAFLLVFGITETHGKPDETDIKSSVSAAVSDSKLNSQGYKVSVSEKNVNGQCVSTLYIRGHGIFKDLDYPCKVRPQGVIVLNQTLLVDEYYTDTPGILMRVKDGKCSREQFYEKDGRTWSVVTGVLEKDCEKTQIKIEVLKEQQVKWEEWYKQKQKETAQQLQTLQQNLQQLQQNLFGGFFGSFLG